MGKVPPSAKARLESLAYNGGIGMTNTNPYHTFLCCISWHEQSDSLCDLFFQVMNSLRYVVNHTCTRVFFKNSKRGCVEHVCREFNVQKNVDTKGGLI